MATDFDAQAEIDSPVIINGLAWRIIIVDGPLNQRGHRYCAMVNRTLQTIHIDRETPPRMVPIATARAILMALAQSKGTSNDRP